MSRVLLVGNGGSLKDKNISDIIDSFDIVCRFNFGGSKITMDENKKYIGTKKNIWFNFSLSNIIPNRDGSIIYDKNVTSNPYNIDYLHSYDKIYVSGIDWSSIKSNSKEFIYNTTQKTTKCYYLGYLTFTASRCVTKASHSVESPPSFLTKASNISPTEGYSNLRFSSYV